MDYVEIEFTCDDGLAVITLNRPERMNAWTYRMSAEMSHAVQHCNDNPDVGAIVLTGAGRGFSLRLAGGYQDVGNYSAPSNASDDDRFASYVNEDGEVFNSGMEQQSFNAGLRLLTGDNGVLRVDANVVSTEDIGFPGFDPETSGINISFPRFDRDKLAVSLRELCRKP